MKINFEDERPIFLQIAEQIEDGILSGAFPEEKHTFGGVTEEDLKRLY